MLCIYRGFLDLEIIVKNSKIDMKMIQRRIAIIIKNNEFINTDDSNQFL